MPITLDKEERRRVFDAIHAVRERASATPTIGDLDEMRRRLADVSDAVCAAGETLRAVEDQARQAAIAAVWFRSNVA